MTATIPQQLAAVQARIETAARSVNRNPATVKLIAVSKTFSAGEIRPALDSGHRLFGENRVQESQSKWPELKSAFAGVELHLIGPLQSNKAHDAVALFDAIHTIDRLKIAQAIAAEMAKQEKSLELFVQVNTGEEPQKAGISPLDAASFVAHCRNVLHLPVSGLMCIPPLDEEAAVHFAFLAKLAKELELPSLSMGMSGDFETAIEFGATHVRVGSSIFGHRDSQPTP